MIEQVEARQNGFVRFDTSPKGASIYIDGVIQINPETEEAIRTPATVSIIEGRRDFKLVLERHQEVSGYVDVYPGRTVNIFRNLVPILSSSVSISPNISLSEPVTVLITCPMKTGDPTQWTYIWAQKAIKMAKDLGHNVIVIEKEDTTYQKVSEAINTHKPRLYIHIGHGCPLSLQGQTECIVTRKFTIDELLSMSTEKLKAIVTPVRTSACSSGICQLENDSCSPTCLYDTNVNLLKGTIMVAVACHSASQLGVCSINYGVESYIGYSDLLMFPVDGLNTQETFGNIQMTMIEELLLGKSVAEADAITRKVEDEYVKIYKDTKYVALPILWNRRYRKVLGNENATIHGNENSNPIFGVPIIPFI